MMVPRWVLDAYQQSALISDTVSYYSWNKARDDWGSFNPKSLYEELARVGVMPSVKEIPDDNHRDPYRKYLAENDISDDDLRQARDAVSAAQSEKVVTKDTEGCGCSFADGTGDAPAGEISLCNMHKNAPSLLERINALAAKQAALLEEASLYMDGTLPMKQAAYAGGLPWHPSWRNSAPPDKEVHDMADRAYNKLTFGVERAAEEAEAAKEVTKREADVKIPLTPQQILGQLETFAMMNKDGEVTKSHPDGFDMPGDDAVSTVRAMIDFAREATVDTKGTSQPLPTDLYKPTRLEDWSRLEPLADSDGDWQYYAPGGLLSSSSISRHEAFTNGVIMGQALFMLQTLQRVHHELQLGGDNKTKRAHGFVKEAIDLVNELLEALPPSNAV